SRVSNQVQASTLPKASLPTGAETVETSAMCIALCLKMFGPGSQSGRGQPHSKTSRNEEAIRPARKGSGVRLSSAALLVMRERFEELRHGDRKTLEYWL